MLDFKNIPPVVKNLLIVNGLFFLATLLLKNQGIDLSDYLGLHYWKSDQFMPHQIVTHMFMHSSVGFSHILFNMFGLFMFGKTLESIWGGRRFLIFYMISGIGAAVVNLLVTHFRVESLMSQMTPEMLDLFLTQGNEIFSEGKNFIDPIAGSANILVNTGMVGASGALYGILVAFGVLFPNSELMMLFIPVPVKAKYFIPGIILMDLVLGVGNFSGDNIAHFAHLGGALVGFILIKVWKQDRSNFY